MTEQVRSHYETGEQLVKALHTAVDALTDGQDYSFTGMRSVDIGLESGAAAYDSGNFDSLDDYMQWLADRKSFLYPPRGKVAAILGFAARSFAEKGGQADV